MFFWFPGSTGITKPAYFSRVPAASYQWGGCSRMTVHLSMRCHWDVWIFFTFYEVVGQPSFSYNWSVKGLAIHIEHKGCLAEKWTQWTQEWDSLQTHWCKTYMPPAGKNHRTFNDFNLEVDFWFLLYQIWHGNITQEIWCEIVCASAKVWSHISRDLQWKTLVSDPLQPLQSPTKITSYRVISVSSHLLASAH